MRKYHKLVAAKTLSYPTDMVFIDTETTTIEPWQSVHRPRLIVGVAHYLRVDNEFNRVYSEITDFRKISDYWVWFGNIMREGRDLVIYAHNWSFDFPVIDGLTAMHCEGYTLKNIIDACPPIIINYVKGRQQVKIIDSMNYFQTSLSQMGSALKMQKGDVKFINQYSKPMLTYCKQDVAILRESMLSLMRYLRDNDLSRLTHTVSSLALSIFVRKFGETTIFIDGNEDRSTAAREAYFGGRTECFKIGKYEGPFYLIDVNSQYPSVMAKYKFPYKTLGWYKRVDVHDLRSLSGRYCVVARVDIVTDIPAYPVKINNRTCFPIGSFTTSLTTPEVEYAFEHNHIVKVHHIIVYEHNYLFKPYVDYFYQQRQKYKSENNDSWSDLSKKLLNTLYGKFGQSHREWVKAGFELKGYPHTRHELDYDTGNLIYIMELNNETFISNTSTEARDSFPSIAAHVTAYGRLIIQRSVDSIGRGNIYYCDTDSLLVNYRGLIKIKNSLSKNKLGSWALEGEYKTVNIKGCKDYQFDEKVKIKGVRHKAKELTSGVFEQLQFSTLRGVIISNELNSPIIRNTTKTLTRKYEKGHVGLNGVVSPFKLSDGKVVSGDSLSN